MWDITSYFFLTNQLKDFKPNHIQNPLSPDSCVDIIQPWTLHLVLTCKKKLTNLSSHRKPREKMEKERSQRLSFAMRFGARKEGLWAERTRLPTLYNTNQKRHYVAATMEKKKKGMLNNTRKRKKTKDSLAGTLRNSCAYKFKPLARLEGI